MASKYQIKEEFINSNMSVEEYHKRLRECESTDTEMSEPNIGDIRNQLVNIQLSLTRTLAMLNEIQTAYGVAEEMEDDEEDDVQDHPLLVQTHIPNVGPVELRRAANLIKGMGSRPVEDIDGNRLEIGDTVGFTIAGPDANNYLQGTVCRADDVYCVDCGTPGLIRIDNDLLNLHKLTKEPGLKGRECQCIVVDEGIGTGDAESDDRAQTRSVMGYTDKSIWLCPRCVIAITDLEYRHLNLNGCCDECETMLEQYEKVEWRA